MNHEAVCRTAPATPGLSNIFGKWNAWPTKGNSSIVFCYMHSLVGQGGEAIVEAINVQR